MSEELTQKLNEINDIKGQIKTSMINKGLAVTDETPFRDYPTAIDNMSSGGEKIFAYYNDTDVAEGKKVMLTKASSQTASDSEFCNGVVPLLINDGLAYYSSKKPSNGETTFGENWFAGNIVEGKVVPASTYFASYKTNTSGISPFAHSCDSGKTIIFGSIGTGNYPYATYVFTGNKFKVVDLSTTGYQHFITEHYWCGTPHNSTGNPVKINHIPSLDYSKQSYDTPTILSYTEAGSITVMFERLADKGKAICRVYSNANDLSSWGSGKSSFEHYNWETKTKTDSTINVIVNTTLTHRYKVCVQTKDYRYVIHPNGYIFLNASIDGLDSIEINEYPQQIKDAVGDRTIVNVQAFYDNYFALMLSDGATLMCNYNDYQGFESSDRMQFVQVEEIEPFTIPNDETIYHRLYSGDRLFWFLNITDKKYVTADKNPAGQFEKENNTSSWFASEPNSIRFNSTVLTGFMTGESKTENGKQLVEVSTVTG